jgi:putative endonuclease
VAFYTYLMASKPYGTLYCGQTDALGRRIWEHREKVRKGFTADYNVNRLVWYAVHDTREGAKLHERQIKKWNRAWKIRLIESGNPDWRDLYETLNQ